MRIFEKTLTSCEFSIWKRFWSQKKDRRIEVMGLLHGVEKNVLTPFLLNSWDTKVTKGTLNKHSKSMSLFVLSKFNCSFTCFLSNTLKTVKKLHGISFLKNIVFKFLTFLEQLTNGRNDLALLSVHKITQSLSSTYSIKI